jgi:hypothetical protein
MSSSIATEQENKESKEGGKQPTNIAASWLGQDWRPH